MKYKARFVFALIGLSLILAVPLWADTEDEKNNIEIYRKAAPAVVNISSITLTRDFFLNIVPKEGVGSGSIIDKRGYILTNHHVIANAQKLEVTLSDGSRWPAKLIGSDPDSDIGIIKIDAPTNKLKTLPLGDSDKLQVGQKVLAMGNPFGLGLTLTTGVISSLGRTLKSRTGSEVEDVIQTDAAINPGNSGGPLLNSSGEIIGINTAIFSPTGASVGIGFAIPINTASDMIPEIIKKGYHPHPWLGATLMTIEPSLAKAIGLKAQSGALLFKVIPGSPAQKAGLKGGSQFVQAGNLMIPKGGDLVVEAEGKPVKSTQDLIKAIRAKRPGETLHLTVIQDNGNQKKVTVKLGERPTEK